eukprot:m.7519 g.7519  ORF g.7519 m.7519 type:complete len:482 (+) comp2765_c0_seq2:10-1455(+)
MGKMPLSPMAALPCRVRALFPLNTSRPGELVLVQDEELFADSQVDEHWFHGRNSRGESGIFPITYVEVLPPSTTANDAAAATTAAPAGAAAPAAHASSPRKRKRHDPVQYEIALPAPPVRMYSARLPSTPPPPETESEAARASSSANDAKQVFVFDLDETLVIFASLLNGDWAKANDKDPAECKALGEVFEKLVFAISDEHFFFEDLEDAAQVHIDSLKLYDDGKPLDSHKFDDTINLKCDPSARTAELRKVAYRYRRAGELYKIAADEATHVAHADCKKTVDKSLAFSVGTRVKVTQATPGGWWLGEIRDQQGWVPESYLKPLFPPAAQHPFSSVLGLGLLKPEEANTIMAAHQHLSALTDKWLHVSRRCLQAVTASPTAELVILTNSELMPTLAKLLLYRLAKYVPIQNVYSSATTPKAKVMHQIEQRFKSAEFYLVGDGDEEAEIAKQRGFPFFRIANLADLQRTCRAIERTALAGPK